MNEIARKRDLAMKCREMAMHANERMASNLRKLAEEYEAEAQTLESDPPPSDLD